MDTYAVIDIGSNSVLLLIAKIEGRDIIPVYEEYKITRISKGLFDSGEISDEAASRTVNVLQNMLRKVKKYGASLKIIGTQPFRIAKNAGDVIEKIHQTIGYEMYVLSPREEALLAYLGATSVRGNNHKQKQMVVDLGGASTEIMFGQNGELLQYSSVPVGAVKISDAFQLTIAQNREKLIFVLRELEKMLSTELNSFLKKHAEETLVVGGTATTLAAIRKEVHMYDSKKLERTVLEQEWLHTQFLQLGQMDIPERKNVPGMEAGREDIIVGGLATLLAITNVFNLNSVIISTRGPRYGAIRYFFMREKDS
jgi:exopolyphosphatase/guanosine-5'-triphosphate,3'-diphosphate pyrophosphatase